MCYEVDSIGLSFESFHVLFSHENPDLSDVLVGEEDSSQGVRELVNQLDAGDWESRKRTATASFHHIIKRKVGATWINA